MIFGVLIMSWVLCGFMGLILCEFFFMICCGFKMCLVFKFGLCSLLLLWCDIILNCFLFCLIFVGICFLDWVGSGC